MMESHWKEILGYARFAPSGDNTQPWSVSRIDASTLAIHFDAHEGQDLYQVNLMGEYLGIGAFLETLAQAAEGLGYATAITITQDPHQVATITLQPLPNTSKDTKRLAIIKRRATDRRNFETTPLDKATLHALESVAPSHITLFPDREQLTRFSDIMALHDRFFWATPALRDNMSKTFRTEDPRTLTDGMPLSHLGLGWEAYGLLATLKLAHTIPLLWNVIGIKAGKAGRKHLMHSGALGMLSGSLSAAYPAFSPAWHIENGRFFQRLWLEATAQGLAFQPCFGPVAVLFHETFQTNAFPTAYDERSQLLSLLKTHFPLAPNTFPIIFFRLGRPKSPLLPHTPRRSVESLIRH